MEKFVSELAMRGFLSRLRKLIGSSGGALGGTISAETIKDTSGELPLSLVRYSSGFVTGSALLSHPEWSGPSIWDFAWEIPSDFSPSEHLYGEGLSISGKIIAEDGWTLYPTFGLVSPEYTGHDHWLLFPVFGIEGVDRSRAWHVAITLNYHSEVLEAVEPLHSGVTAASAFSAFSVAEDNTKGERIAGIVERTRRRLLGDSTAVADKATSD